MKFKTLKVLLCLLLTVPMMNGCGRHDPAVTELVSVESEVTTSTQEDDTFTYNGTFDEEVFENLCKDITIIKKKLKCPVNLKIGGMIFLLKNCLSTLKKLKHATVYFTITKLLDK